MSFTQEVLTKNNRDLLVSGFIRNNSIYLIPFVILKLCLLFFDEVFYWTINGKQMKKCIEMKVGDSIKSKQFFCNNIKCWYILYPNGMDFEDKGFSSLGIILFFSLKLLHIFFFAVYSL